MLSFTPVHDIMIREEIEALERLLSKSFRELGGKAVVFAVEIHCICEIRADDFQHETGMTSIGTGESEMI